MNCNINELLVLRYLIDNPCAMPDLSITDFANLTSQKIYKTIRQYDRPLTPEELAVGIDRDFVEQVFGLNLPNNPAKLREMLIKARLLRDAKADGRGDLRALMLTNSVEPETGAEKEVWTDWYNQVDLSTLSKRIGELNQKRADKEYGYVKLCRGSQLGFVEPHELAGALRQTSWLIDDILLKNTFIELIAPQKAGKSQLAYQLAYSVQNGIEFLGHKTQKQDVLYVDYELESNEIYERCESYKKFAKDWLGQTELENIKILSLNKEVGVSLDDVLYLIRQKKVENPNLNLVIFDNFYSFAERDTNNVTDVKNLLKKIWMGVGEDITIVVVNHTNKAVANSDKNGVSYYDILTSAFGSNAHGMFAADVIYIEPKLDGRVVWCAGRHINPSVKISCRFDKWTNWFFKVIPEQHDFKNNDDEEQEIRDYIGNGKNLKEVKKKFPELKEETLISMGYYVRTPEGKKDRRVYPKEGF